MGHRRREMKRAGRRRIAALALFTFVLLQAVCLAVFAADPGGAPFRGGLLEALWMQRRPGLAIAFIALIGAGPVLSLVLWRLGGWRRWLMVAMWIAFIIAIDAAGAGKFTSVGRALWSWKVEPMLGQ